MIIRYLKNLKLNGLDDLGQKSFYMGTFFLGSALILSIIFYLTSICCVLISKKISLTKDKYNQILLISSGIMIFSNLNSTIYIKGLSTEDILNIWISLFNWIPLFLLFSCSTFYLNSKYKRQKFSKFLIAGTIPILISCVLEKWFNINGIFRTLNGLVVWYMDKVDYSDISISGLFSNKNYTGIWLSCVLGFALYELLTVKKKWFNKIIIIFINLLFIYFSFYTFSRNAILGVFTIFIVVFKKFKLIIPFSLGYIILNFFILTLPNFNLLIPTNLKRFFILNIQNIFNFNRIEIFSIVTNLIKENPLLGWGASTFPKMYEINGGIQSVQHSHNIILELTYNYGIFLSFLLTGLVSTLLLRCLQIIYKEKNDKNSFTLENCWLASSIVATISHLSDITYYDGRISILIWILLSGLKCIIKEQNLNLNNKEVIYN